MEHPARGLLVPDPPPLLLLSSEPPLSASPSSSGPAPAGQPPRIGQRIGPFQLVERLDLWRDVGLYRAERPSGSRQPQVVAIRLAEAHRDEQAGAWVRHEYDVLRILDDPRIPRAHGYYSSQIAVAQSFVDGMTFAEIFDLRRAGKVRIDLATAIDITTELAQALRHAHGAAGADGPVVHAQICPERVMLRRDGQVIVTGFGTPPRPLAPGYTPPEVAAGAFLDPRTDQWALGAFLVELLLGHPLYTGSNAPERAAIEYRVEPWVKRIEQRFPNVARILAKLLAPAAGARYGREMELVSDLLAVSRETQGRADRLSLISHARAAVDAEHRADADAQRALEKAAEERTLRAAAEEAEKRKLERDARADAARAAEMEQRAREAELRAQRAEAELQAANARAEAAAEARRHAATEARLQAAAEAQLQAELSSAHDLPNVEPEVQPEPVEEDLDLPPPAAPDPEPVMATAEVSDDDPSFGFGRTHAHEDGPRLPQFDPLEDPAALPGELEPSMGLGPFDEEDEVTELQISVPEPTLERTEVDTRSPEERAEAARRPVHTPGAWQPTEYAAMAAIFVLACTTVGFLIWRFV